MSRALSLLLLALAMLLTSTVWAQSGDGNKPEPGDAAESKPEGDKPDGAKPDAKPKREEGADAEGAGDAAEDETPEPEPPPGDSTGSPSAAPKRPAAAPKDGAGAPTPKGKKRSKRSKKSGKADARRGKPKGDKRGKGSGPRGAIVVSLTTSARVHGRALARAVYRDAALRPDIDEGTAQVLSGAEPPEGRDELAQHASVVKALMAATDEEVQRRLAGSLARDLNVRLVVLVSKRGEEPTARVVRMPDEQLLAVKLTATKKKPVTEPPTWDWTDATAMLRELAIGAPPPGPRKPQKDGGGTALPSPKPDEGEEETSLLTSPWFWGGLGLVVTVGATVLILSQTALNEPDMVSIGGRVAP